MDKFLERGLYLPVVGDAEIRAGTILASETHYFSTPQRFRGANNSRRNAQEPTVGRESSGVWAEPDVERYASIRRNRPMPSTVSGYLGGYEKMEFGNVN